MQLQSRKFDHFITLMLRYLYELLTNEYVVKQRIPIQIACNKVDISLYKKTQIKKQLEKEL